MERLKIFGLLFILLGLLATLTLVRQAQELRNRAIGEGTLTFIDSQGNQLSGNPPTTASQNVRVKLTFGGGTVVSTPTPTSTIAPTATLTPTLPVAATNTPIPSPTSTACNVTASVSPTTTTRGSTVTFTALGFSPNTAVTLTVTGPSSTAPATVTSDSNGQVVATLQIDLTDQQGVYTITATSTCGGSSVSASATLQVN